MGCVHLSLTNMTVTWLYAAINQVKMLFLRTGFHVLLLFQIQNYLQLNYFFLHT